MTDTATVLPPDRGAWWDVDQTTAAVLTILRLSGGDVDEARVRALVPSAGDQLNLTQDRPEGTAPATAELPTLQQLLERLVVVLYHGLSGDPVDDILGQLSGLRHRWGLA